MCTSTLKKFGEYIIPTIKLVKKVRKSDLIQIFPMHVAEFARIRGKCPNSGELGYPIFNSHHKTLTLKSVYYASGYRMAERSDSR